MWLPALSCLLLLGQGVPPPSRLAVIGDAPDCTLVNQDGKTVKLSDFKGKVLLVSFVFTTCNGTCPATTHRMAKVQQLLAAKGKRCAVEFVTITLDPQRDTPAALRKYIQLYDLATSSNAVGWTFLTGAPDNVAKVLAAWGMWTKPLPNGQLDHPSRIFLVDPRMKIREIYNVDLLRTQDVIDDILQLS